MRSKAIVILALGLVVLSLAGLGAARWISKGTSTDNVSQKGPSTPEEFAQDNADLIIKAIVTELQINTADEEILDYAAENYPQVASEKVYQEQVISFDVLANALQAVVQGANPDDVYEESGYSGVGVDKSVWDWYAENTSNKEFIADLREKAKFSHEEYLEYLLPQLKPIYIRERIREAVCQLPKIKERITAKFVTQYDNNAPPTVAQRSYACNRLAREWVVDFARQMLDPADPELEGWERHLPLFSEWE